MRAQCIGLRRSDHIIDAVIGIAFGIAPTAQPGLQVDRNPGGRSTVIRRITPRATKQRIRSGPTDQRVIAITCIQRIVTRTARQRVVVRATKQLIVRHTPGNAVAACIAIQHVTKLAVSILAGNGIVASAAVNRVPRLRDTDVVIASTAIDQIIVRAASTR